MTFAIGDIHGCDTALAKLLEDVKPGRDDRLVFLGDYVDRGPNSRGVIERLIKLAETVPCIFLRGNHEVMMLKAREDLRSEYSWQGFGGMETLSSYGCAHEIDWVSMIPAEHWKFIEETRRTFETEKHIFVHACLDSKVAVEEQDDLQIFWERFETMKPHISGKKVICGHTTQETGEIADSGFAVCIDTSAVYGGWLTCLEAESGRFWQANEKGQAARGKPVCLTECWSR